MNKIQQEAIRFKPGVADVIHPAKKHTIETGDVDIAKVLPDNPIDDQSYLELIASEQYNDVIQRLEKYAGKPITQQNVGGVVQGVLNALSVVLGIEKQHKERLEQLAVDLVFQLPYFKPLKDQYEKDAITVDVNLLGSFTSLENQEQEAPEEEEEGTEDQEQELAGLDLELFSALNNIDNEVLKRKFANAMIQGSGVEASHAYHLVKRELDQINPMLIPLYGLIMSITDILYWLAPPGIEQQAASATALGKEEIEFHENGTATIKATGIIFPVLVHELVKAAVELVSYGSLPQDIQSKKQVFQSADKLEYETLDIMLGPKLWSRLVSMIDSKNQDILLNVYQKILSVPSYGGDEVSKDFVFTLKKILAGGDEGKKLLANFIQEVRQEIDDYEKSHFTEE